MGGGGGEPDWLRGLSEDERGVVEAAGFPDEVEPMLATLTDERFSSDDWVYERKLDGERVVAMKRGGKGSGDAVELRSRNGKAKGETYPELVDALVAQRAGSFVADGEVVAFDGAVTSFSRLQGRMQVRDADEARASGVAVKYYLFDLLYLDGYAVVDLPLRRRKALLRRVLDWGDPLRWVPHRNGDGEAYYEAACRKGWEGVIAKRADSAYRGSRSTDWLKFKCTTGQELVVGGFTEPRGRRPGLGALLVGYYEGDALRYAGKVGTGFDDETAESLAGRLERLERKTPAFADPPDGVDGVHWVTPELVAEVGFTEWTGSGKLRHPRFLGLRDDKAAGEVVREEAGG